MMQKEGRELDLSHTEAERLVHVLGWKQTDWKVLDSTSILFGGISGIAAGVVIGDVTEVETEIETETETESGTVSGDITGITIAMIANVIVMNDDTGQGQSLCREI